MLFIVCFTQYATCSEQRRRIRNTQYETRPFNYVLGGQAFQIGKIGLILQTTILRANIGSCAANIIEIIQETATHAT